MKTELGKFLYKCRGEESLRSYSKKLNISHSHLDSIEKGIDPKTKKPVNLSHKLLNRISEVTGVHILKIMHIADNKVPFQEILDGNIIEITDDCQISNEDVEQARQLFLNEELKKEKNNELDEYDLLFNKFKDLEQNDKELIKNIIETRKKQIDEQLGESE